MPQRLRVTVDHNKCVGTTMCLLTAPKVFALNENGQSIVVNLEGDTQDRIVEAAEQCPQVAIMVEDADTGETLYPLQSP